MSHREGPRGFGVPGDVAGSGNSGDLRKTVAFTAAGVAAVYYLLAKIGLFFLVQPDGFAAFWPAAGLLPAALLILRKKDRVPTVAAVFASISIANMTAGMSPATSVAYAAVNCAESVAAAWALGRITGGKVATLGTGDFFRFLLFCVLAICGGSAIFGAAVSVVPRREPVVPVGILPLVGGGRDGDDADHAAPPVPGADRPCRRRRSRRTASSN